MSKDEREEILHRQFGAMRDALEYIASRYDCDYTDTREADRPVPCPCSRCTAKRALATEVKWRFMGSSPDRRNAASEFSTSRREHAIVEAWKKYMTDAGGPRGFDLKLAQILRDGTDNCSPRDWYVATTIIQWLATNVGSCILNDAGYFYDEKK